MDYRRVAELHDPYRKSGGTGYLIRDNLILTAHHVIAPLRESGILNRRYHIRLIGDYDQGRTDWIIQGCYLCWDSTEHDLALLKLEEGKLGFLSNQNSSSRFGKLGGKTLLAEGMGFPAVQEIENRQNPQPIRGHLSRIAALKERQLQLEVTSLLPACSSQWQGISGTALFVNNFLVGVIVETNKSFAEKALWATPISAVADDTEFCKLVLGEPNRLLPLQNIENDDTASDPPNEIDFQPYREAVIYHYSQQRHLYTPTDALLPLEARSVERQAQDDEQKQQREKTVEQFPVLEGLRKYAFGNQRKHVLLAGRPGSGKSTTLRQLAVSLAEEGQVPVLVKLKGDRPVLELIQAEFRRRKQRVTLEQIDEWLLVERLVLLLDGVNEIPNNDLRVLLAQFREDNPTVPMIFTTRDLLTSDLGISKRLEMKPLSERQMREFVGKYLPEQGDRLLDQLRDRLRELAETPLLLKLLCDVFDPETNQIPQNRVELFQWFDRDYRRIKKEIEYVPVSENFWEYKSEILQYLAFSMIQGDEQTTDLQKPPETWLTIHKNRATGILETWLHQRGTVDAPTKAKLWLKDLCNHDLLQDAAKPDEIEFHHQLFQEYYAAEYLLEIFEDLTDEQLKRDYLNYVKWTEPLSLMLALVETETHALRLVALAKEVDLMLGARLGGQVQPEFQKKAVDWIRLFSGSELLRIKFLAITRSLVTIPELLKALSHESPYDAFGGSDYVPDYVVHRNAVEALGNLQSEAAIPALLKALDHSDSVVCRTAAEALGNLQSEAMIPGLLNALENSDDSVVRRTAAEALGKFYQSEAVIPGLLKALEDREYWVRDKAAEALGNLQSREVIPALLKKMEYFCSNEFEIPNRRYNSSYPGEVRMSAAQALGNLQVEVAIPVILSAFVVRDGGGFQKAYTVLEKFQKEVAIRGLLKALEDPDLFVRSMAAQVLGEFQIETTIPSLLRALEDSHSYVRERAANALEKFHPSEAIISGLLKALRDPDSDVHNAAALALGKFQNEAAIPELLKAWENSTDFFFQKSAAEALGNLQSEAAIPELLKALESPHSDVRWSVVEVLGKFQGEAVIPGLLNALNPDVEVSYSTAKVLGKFQDEAAIPVLLKALEGSDVEVSYIAAEALGKFQSEAVMPGLLKALENSNPGVCRRATEVLGNLQNEAAIPGLLKALESSDLGVSWDAAKALGKFQGEAVIPGLLKALEHLDVNVHRSVAEALVNLQSEAAIPGLLKALEDSDHSVRETAVKALVNLQNEAVIPVLLKTLKDPDSGARTSRAVEALGKFHQNEAVMPALLNALEHWEYWVRETAAEVLGNLQNEAAIPVLLKALEDPDSRVRWSTAKALGNFESEAVIPGLLKTLEHTDPEVRRSAAKALANLQSEAAISGLLKALEDRDSEVRLYAAVALGNLQNEAAIPELLKALEDSDLNVRLIINVHRSVTEALVNLQSEAAIPGLLKALEDSDHDVRQLAAEALGNLQSEAAIPGLLNALEHTDSGVRRSAAEALGRLESLIPLSDLWRISLLKGDTNVLSAIAAIQNGCKLYNYEIWQTAIQNGQR